MVRSALRVAALARHHRHHQRAAAGTVGPRPAAPAVVERAAEPFITMAELLERVVRRTMYAWMQKGYVPYTT